MEHRLSNKLSPQAKKMLLMAPDHERVLCLLQVAPSRNVQDLSRAIEHLGGSVRSWMEEAHLMGVDLDASQLSKLANLDGVTYIEAGGHYSR